jgi:hypothetical protein
MSTVRMKENPQLNDQMLRTEKLVFSCAIVHNATPANKTFSSDVPSVSLLRAQGQTAAVDAIEVLAWTAPNDAAGIFGLYLSIGKTVTPSLGPVPTAEDYADAVYSVSVRNAPASAALAAAAVTGPGGSTSFLTPLGNIAIEITNGNLATTDQTLIVDVNYREQIK